MPEHWLLEYESPTGATYATTQAYLPANWTRATVTLRRRAPHTIAVEIPRWTHHRLSDFVAGRLWRLSRNGVYWQAGFLDAPSLVGYDPVARRFGAITLPGWGNAYALALHRNQVYSAVGVTFANGSRVDQCVSALLDLTYHGGVTDANWFAAAGRTIYTSGTTIDLDLSTSGKTGLEAITELLDLDAAAWRTGIDGSGAWTFKAGTSVEQTLTASVSLVDQANCQIVDFRQDGSQIATGVNVVSRVPLGNNIRLTVEATSGESTLNVTSTAGLAIDDVIVIGPGTVDEETETISSVRPTHTPWPQIVIVGSLGADHAADTAIVSANPGEFRVVSRSAATSVRDAHHERIVAEFNDQLVSTSQRNKFGDAFLAAYNHVLQTATVDIADTPTIEALLDAGVQPGDTIGLTSYDPDLSAIYSATAVKVQEIQLDLTPSGAYRARLTLGDPHTDALAVVERRLRAAHYSATAGIV